MRIIELSALVIVALFVWLRARHGPEPRAFLRELKRKAGLPADHWSDTLRAHRYTVESIP